MKIFKWIFFCFLVIFAIFVAVVGAIISLFEIITMTREG